MKNNINAIHFVFCFCLFLFVFYLGEFYLRLHHGYTSRRFEVFDTMCLVSMPLYVIDMKNSPVVREHCSTKYLIYIGYG